MNERGYGMAFEGYRSLGFKIIKLCKYEVYISYPFFSQSLSSFPDKVGHIRR